MSRRRTLVSRLGLLTLGAVLALGLAEGGLRIFSPFPFYGYRYIPPQQGLFQYDPVVGWHGRPNATGRFANLDFDVHVSLDSLGHRNSSPPWVAGTSNVLVLGDSFGWGWGVEDHQVFPQKLMAEAPHFNLYNLSAPGYGTDQEVLLFERFLAAHPGQHWDDVVLLLTLTDFTDVAHDVRYTYPKPRFILRQGELTLGNVPVPRLKVAEYDRQERSYQQVRRGPLAWSHLANLIRFRGERALANLATLSGRDEAPGADPSATQRRADLDLVVALVERLAAVCADRQSALHVVLLMTQESDPQAWQWLNLEQRLAEDGIETSVFRGRRFPSTELWYDRHLSPYGHRRLARHVLELLGG